MNIGNQPNFLSKKREYPKHYEDDRDRDRNRNQHRERNRDRDRDQLRGRERNPRERLHEQLQFNYHKSQPQPHHFQNYQDEDIYSHHQKPNYKRKDPYYIDKDSKDLLKKNNYSDLDQRISLSIRPSNPRKQQEDNDEPKEKRLYSYILLPRNYYKYITKNFRRLCDELYDRIRDICDIQYDYSIPHFHEYVFRYSTETIASRALAIRIISEYLFNEMRDNFQNMTYLKVSILIPDHVIGFIIGIEGKNINRIRDETGAKIEVFQKNSSKRYRQIELSGSPRSIARASEKIYSIALKYINFNHEPRATHSRSISPFDSSTKLHSNHSREYKSHRYINEYHSKGRDRDRDRDRERNNDYDKDDQYNNYIDLQESQSNYLIDPNSKKEEGEADIPSQQVKMYQSQSIKDYLLHHSRSHSHSSSQSMPRPNNSQIDLSIPIPFEANNQSLNQKPSSSNPSKINQDDLIQIPQKSIISPSPQSGLSSADLTKLLKKTNEQGEVSKEKCTLEVLFSSTSMNLLKQCKSNIWIDLENNYHCTVSKRTQKSLNDDISIITINGTPEENTLALYQLQKYLIDSSYSSKSNN